MARGVAARRAVTTADVAATQAEAQVDPAHARTAGTLHTSGVRGGTGSSPASCSQNHSAHLPTRFEQAIRNLPMLAPHPDGFAVAELDDDDAVQVARVGTSPTPPKASSQVRMPDLRHPAVGSPGISFGHLVPPLPHESLQGQQSAQDEQQNADRQQAKPFKFVCPLDHHLPQGANQGHLDRQHH